MGDILVLNAGSSSVKFALFGADGSEITSGAAAEIGSEAASLRIGDTTLCPALPDHRAAMGAILAALAARGVQVSDLSAAAHRVVHGGPDLTRPSRVTPATLSRIAACSPLAPLHNPHNLAAIMAVAAVAPGLPQTVSFDTAFHATAPDEAQRYALPPEAETLGLRRYGFHGISYSGLVRDLPALSGRPLPRRLLACHLGNGASLCAIVDGCSVATTMGYSPLDGLTMGTRAGGIDGNAVLRLAGEVGIDRASRILNHESGLLGLSGIGSDMRALDASDAPEAAFAIRHFCYWTLRHAGSMISAMQGIDSIAFTGGIGENSANVRAYILRGLGWTGLSADMAANDRNALALHRDGSDVTAWVVPAREEATIAREARRVLVHSDPEEETDP
ncbi:MAG: acetate/propionate family kinase [Rhodobacteraceae bacterium]|nr:acetate/propionate family kinase [Paracoccaceae bacterium]